MTIQETKYNIEGDIVGRREVDPLEIVDLGELPPYVLVTGDRHSAIGIHVPAMPRSGLVLPPHSYTGEDGLFTIPDGQLLVGDRINQANLVFPSSEPGVAERRITSTPNEAPPRRGRHLRTIKF